jgi:BolA family transcriptional regulator, general stress-responsive regulator
MLLNTLLTRLSSECSFVIDYSFKHKGHAGADANGQSHYRILVINHFCNEGLLSRHREVYKILYPMSSTTHSISLTTLTSCEYKNRYFEA